MARVSGDKNYSAREKRLVAKLLAADAKLDVLKAQLKVKDARLKEMREKL